MADQSMVDQSIGQCIDRVGDQRLPGRSAACEMAAAEAVSSSGLIVRDLGGMPYADAFNLQKQLQQQVIADRAAAERASGSALSPSPSSSPSSLPLGYLLLVEHDPPVITVSRRSTARQHLIATPEQLAANGVEIAETDRGGDITYHGPGQLVAYPILDLNGLHLRLHGYMRMLEKIIIDTLAPFGIDGQRDPEATGVWVQPHAEATSTATGRPARKICAMGVRIVRWVSMHGLALNVTTNLDHFNLIVPCGLHGRTVTSMQQELMHRCPTMQQVKQSLVQQFAHTVNDRRGMPSDELRATRPPKSAGKYFDRGDDVVR